jgi:hypothetical protein
MLSMSSRWRYQFNLLPPNREDVECYTGLMTEIDSAFLIWVTCEEYYGMLGVNPILPGKNYVCDKKNHMVEIKLNLMVQYQRIRYGGI